MDKNLEVHTKSLILLHFWTGSSKWCTECQERHSSRKI